MNATAAMPPGTVQKYLLRVEDSNVVFTPIKKTPEIKNFFILETRECYKFSKEAGKFIPAHAQGILYVKHGEVTQKLFGFKSTNHDRLMSKIANWVIDYLKLR